MKMHKHILALSIRRKIYKQGSGQMLVELAIVIGIVTIMLPALLTGLVSSRQTKPQQEQNMQATALFKQTVNALQQVRDTNWTTFAVDGTYHPVIVNNAWTLASGSAMVNGFTQQAVISDVYRNSSGAIVSTGGTLDPSTKQAVVTISWTKPYASSVYSTLYLTRTTNLTWTQSTVSDFNQGTTTNTTVSATTSGGMVNLSTQSYADWCNPQNFIVNQVTLPKLSNAIYALQGGAYLGAGDGTNSQAFINVGITTPQPPASPSASITGSFNGTFTTNAIFSDGHYVYLATNSSTQIIILDISHTPYTQVGTVTIPGGQAANSVYVSGNILFATSGNNLYTFDVTTKTGSHILSKSSVQMYAGIWSQPSARQVVVANGKAYVGTGGSLLGLQSFTFNSDGSNLQFATAALLTFSQQSQGLSIDATGHYAYMAFNNASGLSFTTGMVVIDLTKTSTFLINYYNTSYTYNTNGMDPRGVAVPNTTPAANRAIIVGIGGTNQYQVVNTSNLANMTQCGGLPISGGVYGVSSILDQYSNAYSYIITGEAGNQFKIIRGGPGGGSYLSSGTFESSTFDAGSSSAFNRFLATINQSPPTTSISAQVAVSSPVNNSCSQASFTYVGPDATANTYFTTTSTNALSGIIPLMTISPSYQNPNRCFRYKLYFSTTDSTQTPTLYQMSTNYAL